MLYHYTNYIAFNGIVGDGSLWLNNVLNMNDAAEMRFYMNGLCKALVDKLKAGKYLQKARIVERFMENEFQEDFNFSAYAACFSRFCDDAAQWERYGRDGSGVCIAFDEKMLGRITDITKGAVSMIDVHYDHDFTNLDIVNAFYELWIQHENLYECLDEVNHLMTDAWTSSAVFKHPSFSSENEVRMVAIPSVADAFPVTPQYHVSPERIKKYYPMDLHLMCKKAGITMNELIREIIIGPKSTQSKAILRDYLKSKGLEQLSEHVRYSDCPLR